MIPSLANASRTEPDIGLLSVVSPVYGCESCLEHLVERIKAAIAPTGMALEILLVNDGSPDNSWNRIVELAALHPEVRGLCLSRNFGQHYAIAAGIEHARGDLVAVMDCDLQDLPEELPKLIDALSDSIDVVFAQRVSRRDHWPKRAGSWIFHRTLTWLTGVPQDHTTANFGVYRREVINAINTMPERERCFPLMVHWTGFSSVSVPVDHSKRMAGHSSYTFGRLMQLAIGIILSYSDKPLRLVVRLGILFSLFAFAMVLLAIFRFLHGDVAVAGFTSIVASIWLVGGASVFCLGLLGLYLGRMFVDAKGRPYYLISKRCEPADISDLSRDSK